MTGWLRFLRLFVGFLAFVQFSIGEEQQQQQAASPADTCSAEFDDDPALQEMVVDWGNDDTETFLAYVMPDVTTFYHDQKVPASKAAPMKFKGLAGKFINMSNQRLTLYWDAGPGQSPALIASCKPFHAVGTSTFPGHVFFFAPPNEPDNILIKYDVEEPTNNYYYDPYFDPDDVEATEENLKVLTDEEMDLYARMYSNRVFNEQYFDKTGREYIAMYPRKRPSHKMWRADYFGQQHWVTTKETQFVDLPPDEKLGEIKTYGKARIIQDDEPRLLQEYRTKDPIFNMSMTVLSCAPRVFEIRNFLSDVEVKHVHKLAAGFDLSLSATGGQGDGDKDNVSTDNRGTRTSYNTWVARETSPIVDAIYRRAADLLRIDEALLRYRGDGEYADLGTEKSIAESLQLVHYDRAQEYTAHHDFGYANIRNRFQPARFATLLLYLNEGMTGGETSFPRWVNAETFKELKVVPEVGKAILFYSQLPDGNFDDLSQHAALPVTDGEKWLMNLWVWDPVYETMSGEYDDDD